MNKRFKIKIALAASVFLILISLHGIKVGFQREETWRIIGAGITTAVFLVFTIIHIKNLRKAE